MCKHHKHQETSNNNNSSGGVGGWRCRKKNLLQTSIWFCVSFQKFKGHLHTDAIITLTEPSFKPFKKKVIAFIWRRYQSHTELVR